MFICFLQKNNFKIEYVFSQFRIKIASSSDFNDKTCAFVILLNIKKVSVVQTNINYVKLRCFIN